VLRPACTEVWIFARAFHHAAPANVAGNIDHGGESPFDSGSTGFPGCYALRLLDQLRIEATGAGNGNREDSPVAVNDIEAEDERNFEARLLYGNLLSGIHPLGT